MVMYTKSIYLHHMQRTLEFMKITFKLVKKESSVIRGLENTLFKHYIRYNHMQQMRNYIIFSICQMFQPTASVWHFSTLWSMHSQGTIRVQFSRMSCRKMRAKSSIHFQRCDSCSAGTVCAQLFSHIHCGGYYFFFGRDAHYLVLASGFLTI